MTMNSRELFPVRPFGSLLLGKQNVHLNEKAIRDAILVAKPPVKMFALVGNVISWIMVGHFAVWVIRILVMNLGKLGGEYGYIKATLVKGGVTCLLEIRKSFGQGFFWQHLSW